MTPFRFFLLLCAIVLAMFTALLTLKSHAFAAPATKPTQSQAEIVLPPRVILNNPIVPDISEQFLREVFSGKVRHWPDGNPIKVVVLGADSHLHQSFIRLRLRMFPYQVQRLWNKRIYSGRTNPPIIVNDIDMMRATVINTPGAIGYLPFEQIEPARPIRSYASAAVNVNSLVAGH